jgi:hypothetical protein
MPARTSRWKAQHKGCQKAVDAVRAEKDAEIKRLQRERDALAADLAWERHGRTCGQCGSYPTRPMCPEGSKLHTSATLAYFDADSE